MLTTGTTPGSTLSPSQDGSPASLVDYGSSPPSSNGPREIEQGNDDENADKVCLKAVECLSDILYAADTGRPLPPGKIIETILQRASPLYLALVIAQHPKALVILAYYHGALEASLAHHSSPSATGTDAGTRGGEKVEGGEFWWLEQMPRYNVRAIAVALGPDWARWMRWPMESVGRGKRQEEWCSRNGVSSDVKGADLSTGTALL